MKKFLTGVLVIVLSVCSLATFTSCSKKFAIKYVINGETVEGTPNTYKKTGNIVDLWVPTSPEGQVFDGWYTKSNYTGVKVTQIPAFTASDKEYFGRYIKDSYDITYYLGDEVVTNATVNSYAPSSSSVTLWFPEAQEGYHFDGWYENADRTGSKIFWISPNTAQDKVYYGDIKEGVGNDFNLRFYVDGEIQDAGMFNSYSYSPNPTTLWQPQIDTSKFSFDGWYANSDYSGDKVTQLSANATGDKDFYGRIREPEGHAQGRTRIQFDVKDKDGNTVNADTFYGKPMLVNVWYKDCSACLLEMPHFQTIYEEYGDEIEFLLINVKDDSNTAKTFLKDNNYTMPYYIDQGAKIMSAYSITVTPTTFFVDRWGYIISSFNGAVLENSEIINRINGAINAA